MSWDLQEAYLEGLDADPDIPFKRNEDIGRVFRPGEQMAPGMDGPTIRENVDAGADVIDLRAMIAELEASRSQGAERR